MTKENGSVVLNSDDTKSAAWLKERMGNKSNLNIKWSSTSELAGIKHSSEGMEFNYSGKLFKLPIIGKHNFINTLQVIKLTESFISLDEIQKALSTFRTPEGRMEIMQSEPFTVVVDFAHTPIALESALKSMIEIKEKESRIICVFGCAGKRDKGRRLMGKVAAELADIVVVTSEDPRDEKLADVNSEILGHAVTAGGALVSRFKNSEEYSKINFENEKSKIEEEFRKNKKPVFTFDEDSINSRKDAVDFSIKIAKPKDIVFITGKGHERSLSFGASETEYPWSDQDTVREVLKNL
jgi:UDP-N-acetylmuramoyl-L-alanyl-D-glutamate--2,6-diaminopimelate ligase